MKRFKLPSWALTSLDVAKSRVLGSSSTEGSMNDDQESRLAMVVAQATVDLEAALGARRLKSRAYSGGKVLRAIGDGTGRFLVPQYPVTAVRSVKWVDRPTGTRYTLDATGVWFDANWVETPNDSAPWDAPVELDVDAGYKAGYNDDHDAALQLAEELVLRLTQIKWTDWNKHVGRNLEVATSSGRAKFVATAIPDDIRDAMWSLKRL